jgi:electron transport complex protein RnfG
MSTRTPDFSLPGRDASPLRVYTTLVGIALIAGLAIALAHEFTRPLVNERRAQLRSAAVLGVLPGAVEFRSYVETADGRLQTTPADSDSASLFAGFAAGGRLIGFAIPAQGMGYQDRIRLLYGLDPATGVLLGLSVLESRETPGLGARIVDDADFLNLFSGLALTFDAQAQVLPLRLATRPGAAAGTIDGITGATVSSQAVASILSDSLAYWLPRLRAEPALLPESGHG